MDTVQVVVRDISSCGLSDSAIGERVGCSQPTIWRIRNGITADCKAATYRALVDLRESLRESKEAA